MVSESITLIQMKKAVMMRSIGGGNCVERSLLRLGGHVDTRVRHVSALLNGDPSGKTLGVLVERNVGVVLDELAVPVGLVE